MKADYHVHTEFSDDSDYPMEEVVKDALKNNLDEICFTIGSDSHKKEHLGTYIDETKEELKTLGFDKFCTFDRMKPTFHKL